MHIVDAAIHPVVARPEHIRAYMEEPWRSTAYVPAIDAFDFIPPGGGYMPELVSDPAALSNSPAGELFRVIGSPPVPADAPAMPGSDPGVARRFLFDRGAEAAILVPKTRGIVADVNLGNVICSATNSWLSSTWLTKGDRDGRYRGSIRVDPRDPDAAVAEIERWSQDPNMVQVVVPLESRSLYGERRYEPIWKAAAEHGLPVAVMADGNFGMQGIRYFAELSLLGPLNFYQHLISLVVQGVLERIPDLKLVFVDGGYDLLMPVFWRTDKDWKGLRFATPWVERPPTQYFAGRVFFCMYSLELGPTDPSKRSEWWEVSGGGDSVMYASRFPRWSYLDPAVAARSVPEGVRARVMGENAAKLYGLHVKAVSDQRA